jgi:uncharacterized protein (UPF0179 family)
MNLPHPEEGVQMVEVEEERMMKILALLRFKEHSPILIKHVKIGPTDHPPQRRVSQPVETQEMEESKAVETLEHCASTSSCPSFACLPS